jgi:hypothetical protein
MLIILECHLSYLKADQDSAAHCKHYQLALPELLAATESGNGADWLTTQMDGADWLTTTDRQASTPQIPAHTPWVRGLRLLVRVTLRIPDIFSRQQGHPGTIYSLKTAAGTDVFVCRDPQMNPSWRWEDPHVQAVSQSPRGRGQDLGGQAFRILGY